ncbi:P-loop containing nucleoside triphosphate hydrolase protein [Podospora aff. communis PSN243]|uniref:ATP-dependent RNA helicase n=1 Tax=Podospora aff. communis PSN243 TaxID=3040156 RepID=A0AAV9H1M9_9PEZI|nr:P-loop containing nucleoside triphosphate hydrolase protein [Podospora aff. communis PSN243]
MDILKVLSRGIKPNPKKHTTSTALPSAGARPNPQFFHDEVAGAALRGKKRKRRKGAAASSGDATDDANDNDDESDVSDVDYFSPKGAAKKKKVEEQSAAAEQAESPKQQRKPRLLDEEECRATLKSHRLKFTILAGRTEMGAAPAKKKAKKGEAEKEKHKEQIFPQPLKAFGELRYVYGVAPQVSDNLVRQGFRVPTEVQMGSLPLLLRPGMAVKGVGLGGVDFLGVAPTGSGKTISFLIPAIDAVLRRRTDEGEGAEENVLQVVVVAPTRELASQIVNEGRKLAIGTGVRVVLMKRSLGLVAEDLVKKREDQEDEEVASDGEEDDASQQSEEESEAEKDGKESDSKETKGPARVDILVTTPKTLLNFLSGEKTVVKNPKAKKALPTVRSLILDEADVLLDPIFRKQTMAIWRACTHPNLALTCWSATMASNIEALITKELEKRAKRLSIDNPYPLIRLVVGLKDTAVPNITHKLIYTATEQGKLLAIRQLLHPVSEPDSGPPLRPPFLVFTQTIERAQSLHDELKYDIPLEAGGSARVAVLHSSLADSIRSKIMSRFRAGEIWVLITTDVLARGVDFAGVNGVVNYDIPGSAAAYVHRAGRTGRAGREGGVAVTFYTKDDIPFVKSVANVIAASEKQASSGKGGTDTSNSTVQKWLLDALPKVAKEDKRKLTVRGVESRRAGGKASITTKSTWELRKERNKLGAIEASKRRKREAVKYGGGKGKAQDESAEEWGGLDG